MIGNLCPVKKATWSSNNNNNNNNPIGKAPECQKTSGQEQSCELNRIKGPAE